MTNDETKPEELGLRRAMAKADEALAVLELELEEHPDMMEAGIAEMHQLVQDLMRLITEKQEEEGWI